MYAFLERTSTFVEICVLCKNTKKCYNYEVIYLLHSGWTCKICFYFLSFSYSCAVVAGCDDVEVDC